MNVAHFYEMRLCRDGQSLVTPSTRYPRRITLWSRLCWSKPSARRPTSYFHFTIHTTTELSTTFLKPYQSIFRIFSEQRRHSRRCVIQRSHKTSSDASNSKIPPLIPSRSYNDRALVRFRALVQDTSLSPEIYLSRLRDGKCGGWGMTDTSQGDGDDSDFDHNHLRDCLVFWAVSVPGETEWYQSASDDSLSARGEFPRKTSYVGTSGTGSRRDRRTPSRSQISHPGRCALWCAGQGKFFWFGPQISTHLGHQMYGNSGNDIPKTTDVLNFVGILSNELQVSSSSAMLRLC